MEFSRQEYWSGVPLSSPHDFGLSPNGLHVIADHIWNSSFAVRNPTLQPLDGCSRPEGPNRRTMFTQALKPPGTPSWVLPLPQTGYLCLKGKFQYSCTFRFCCRWDRGLGLLILPTWHYALRTATLLGDPSLPEAMCILIWPVYPWGSYWFCEPWDIDLHFHTSPFPQWLSTPGSRIQMQFHSCNL